MLASAHHFPEPHFGTAAQTFWLSSPLEPSVRPLDSGWTQLQISQFPLVGKAGVRSGEQALGLWS